MSAILESCRCYNGEVPGVGGAWVTCDECDGWGVVLPDTAEDLAIVAVAALRALMVERTVTREVDRLARAVRAALEDMLADEAVVAAEDRYDP